MKYLLILLFVLSIIINVIISSTINENFETNIKPDQLIYLTNTDTLCPICATFNETWKQIEKTVSESYFKYNFVTVKYNIDDTQGKAIASANKINTPPAIILKRGDSYNMYNGSATDAKSILLWTTNF
jgi:thioredoxin-related protein